nr:LacI family DNA-binding transcriptional regulator [Tateyamaria omphalii]
MTLTNNTLPTLEDVARVARVSTATVSRCLNRPGQVSDSTRDRVMRAVEELGYTPNFGARALAAKRTFTIGAITPTMENAIFARGLQAFQETLNEAGYTLLVSSTGYDPQREAEQIRNLVARGADGLLLIGYERDPDIYAFLEARKVPYLLSWAHRPEEKHPAVGFNNCKSMTELTKAVLAEGHREIGIISAQMEGNDRATDRVKGIRVGLHEAGLDPQRAPLVETPYSVENGANAFEEIMRSAPQTTAVMCVNDVLAVGAMNRAHDMGLDVPLDVSITGFDDIELAKLVKPKLTTVHVPHRLMGSLAAQQLMRFVEKTEAPQIRNLASIVEKRETLAKPRKNVDIDLVLR